eukprot:TRINITY_DN1075_c1_g1_i3.p1 TRINITY_DN1075_c1_g1~~TRINITY_DN1075_c1_g1_i3.p1  ORF type:complete len:274 (+),score=96.00 TRINITY_DN1075_c1_g1_i3:175-996(+)
MQATALLGALCALAASGLTDAYKYHGDGTYYGGIGGKWGKGTCHQTYRPSGYMGIALNTSQYGGDSGKYCGACIKGVINKNGKTKKFKGVVDNRCATCGPSDLDFGVEGDGKYDIKWDFVKCPQRDIILKADKASNAYYGLISVEGGGRVDYVEINGKAASHKNGLWEVHDSEGRLGCGPKVYVKLNDGRRITKCMSASKFGGDCHNGGKRCRKRRDLWEAAAAHGAGAGDLESESDEREGSGGDLMELGDAILASTAAADLQHAAAAAAAAP